MIEIIHTLDLDRLDVDRLYDLLIDIVLEAEEYEVKEKSA